jgi:hypothetical protein
VQGIGELSPLLGSIMRVRTPFEVFLHEAHQPCWFLYSQDKFHHIYRLLNPLLNNMPLSMYCGLMEDYGYGYVRGGDYCDEKNIDDDSTPISINTVNIADNDDIDRDDDDDNDDNDDEIDTIPDSPAYSKDTILFSIEHFSKKFQKLENKFNFIINKTKSLQSHYNYTLTPNVLYSVLLYEFVLQKYDYLSTALVSSTFLTEKALFEYYSALKTYNALRNNDKTRLYSGHEGFISQSVCGTSAISFDRSDLELGLPASQFSPTFCPRTGKKVKTSTKNGPNICLELIYYFRLRFNSPKPLS